MPQEKNKSDFKDAFALLALVSTIFMIILSVLIVFKIKNTNREFNYIGRNPESIKTMSFRGDSKVTAIPDIAVVSMGLTVEKKKVSDAQAESTKTMNAFITKLKATGIDSKDIKTNNYSVYPQYDWTSSKQVLRGYQVTQNVEIKIRNLDKISEVLGFVGEFNLNQVGDLRFDVDNKEEYLKQAKEEAIKKAKINAEETAKSLGIQLGRIVSYDEYADNVSVYNGYPMYAKSEMMVDDLGGAAPEVSVGNAELKMNVGITYEIN